MHHLQTQLSLTEVLNLRPLKQNNNFLPVDNRRWRIFLTRNQTTLSAVVSISDPIVSLTQHRHNVGKKTESHLGVSLKRPQASPAALVRTKRKQVLKSERRAVEGCW